MTKFFLVLILTLSHQYLFSQTEKKLKTDSLNFQTPTYKYKRIFIKWPLSGFVYKKSGIYYENYNLSFNTLTEISQLEPKAIKKENLLQTIHDAKRYHKNHTLLLLPSIFLTSAGICTLLVAAATTQDNKNPLIVGSILTSAGIVGIVISGRIHTKSKKANRELVDVLNN